MKKNLMDILICPRCKSPLLELSNRRDRGETISEGDIHCSECRMKYPIREGIPLLFPSPDSIQTAMQSFDPQREVTGAAAATPKIAQLAAQYSRNLTLDAGCGPGVYTNIFNSRVVCIDKHPGLLLQARAHHRSPHPLTCVAADAADLPFKTDSFDLVLCSQVLEYLAVPEHAVLGFDRVCRSDGRILVAVSNRNGLIRCISSVLHRRRLYPSKRFYGKHLSRFQVKQMKELGFTIHGCIGGMTHKYVGSARWWGLVEQMMWHLPGLGGTLIGMKRGTNKQFKQSIEC